MRTCREVVDLTQGYNRLQMQKNAGIKHAPSLTPSSDWDACELHRFKVYIALLFYTKKS